MAQLSGEQNYPVQSVYIPQLSSVRLPMNSGLSRALRKPLSHHVRLSNNVSFIPTALEAYKSASSNLENHQPSRQAIKTWCDADAVCFDVDSTVCLDEGIDELADFCGAGQAVAQWTARAMAGSVAFEEALAARLSLFKPSIDQVQDCIEKRPPRISPGIAELIVKLKARNTDAYLVSGGFRQMIKICTVWDDSAHAVQGPQCHDSVAGSGELPQWAGQPKTGVRPWPRSTRF